MKEFLSILSPDRARNVAVFTSGKKQEACAEKIKEMVEAQGVNYLGAFAVKGKKGDGVDPTNEDIAGAIEFAHSIVDSLKQNK